MFKYSLLLSPVRVTTMRSTSINRGSKLPLDEWNETESVVFLLPLMPAVKKSQQFLTCCLILPCFSCNGGLASVFL